MCFTCICFVDIRTVCKARSDGAAEGLSFRRLDLFAITAAQDVGQLHFQFVQVDAIDYFDGAFSFASGTEAAHTP